MLFYISLINLIVKISSFPFISLWYWFDSINILPVIGCGNLLNQIEYISADLGFERGKKQESTFLSVTNFLLKNNFELVEVNLIRITALFKNKKTNI